MNGVPQHCPAVNGELYANMAKRTLTKSYLHVTRKFPFTGLTVGQQLYEATTKNPDKEMFVFYADKERITFKQMKHQSQQFAASLILKGLKKGDTIAAWGANHSEWLVALFACTQVGIILVPLRLEFTLETVETILLELQCRALLITRTPTDLFDMACEIIPEIIDNKLFEDLKFESLPDLEFVVIGGNLPDDPGELSDDNSLTRGVYSMEDFLTLSVHGNETDIYEVSKICSEIDMDDPCTIYFTSGSTGMPKPTTISHHAILNNLETGGAFRAEVNDCDHDWESTRYAISMPFSGSNSFIGTFLPVVRGCTSIVLCPTLNATTMANALQDERVTEVTFELNQLTELLNLSKLNKYDFSNLRIVCMGGSYIPHDLREKVKKISKHTTGFYCMTELLLPFIGNPSDPADKLDDDAYYPVGGIETKVVDDEGVILPVNTTGEILIRGYNQFLCYWGDQLKTREIKDSNGWLHTGDLGQMDQDGYIRIRGRKKYAITRQGVKLSPVDLEAYLYRHPQVKAALVVGVPDARVGEEICACIIGRRGHSLVEDDIRRYFSTEKVHGLLIIKHVLFVDEFPTTETGKVSRLKMTEIAKEKCIVKPNYTINRRRQSVFF